MSGQNPRRLAYYGARWFFRFRDGFCDQRDPKLFVFLNGLVSGEILPGNPHDLHGKIDGFRLRFSLKPIHGFSDPWEKYGNPMGFTKRI